MNSEHVTSFRNKLHNEGVLGVFSKTSDPSIIEAMSLGGIDYVILDMEHGPNDLLSVQNLIRAAELGGAAAIVRVPEGAWNTVSAVLDLGADGVQVPQIVCADDVRKVKEMARFHPNGQRGVCRYVRAAGFASRDKTEYFRSADENILILQLEGKEAIDNLDAILEEGGMDVLFIGPYDLSQSIGVPGEVTHPLVAEQMRKIVERCLQADVAVGTFVESAETSDYWRSQGVKYISYSVDVGLMYSSCANLSEQFKQSNSQVVNV